MERVKQGTSQEEGPSTSTALVPSNTDTASSSSTQKTALEEHRQKNVPLFQGGFKPFHKDPGKQERYDKYLELVKLGHKDPYSLIMTSAQTEWEAEHEKEEFHQAAKLYRPLAGMMAMRFTRGGNVDDDTKDTKSEELVDTSDAGKAASMKMYGKLTRDVQEWHPDKLVCKRFNVPHPYPGSTIVGLPTIKRDKYSVFNFLNFSTPTEQDQTERSSHQETSHNPPKEQPEGVPSESRVEKELNKSKNMKSIFSHLVETENNIQKNTKPVSFNVKSTKSNKPKEFKSIFSHLEKEKDSVKPRENIPVAMETESERKDGGQETKKDKNSDLLKKSSENKEGEPNMDLFRAIFRNTDSEDSSSSDEDESKKDSSVHDDEDTKDNSEKMETGPADDRLSTQGDRLPTESNIGVLPGNGEPMETLSSRLSPQLVSDESDSYGPALPPPLKDGNEDCTSSRTSHQSSDFIDLTKSDPPDYIDLTKRSSRKHKHKDKHKSKKDKKDKHKKSKHKKKNKKKEKKKKSKAQSDSSDTNTSDKDTDDDDDTITEREILNRLKSMKPRQRMKAADLL
ncbi:G patch domain-containing protein 1-like [Ruditapes philippinarum]|uniref:G patch domain-containing protein 1-like n=1 Tax=Ruditapes philippinarum TaxID=129788 RepID=UPI00295B61B0|nr:G patch domain-containing protein 1-like [Ruditapes philippinarum]